MWEANVQGPAVEKLLDVVVVVVVLFCSDDNNKTKKSSRRLRDACLLQLRFFFIIILCLYYLAPCAIVGICLDSCLMVRIVESRSETSLGSFNKSTNQQPRCFICESTYFYDFLLLLRVDDDDDREEASSGIFFFFRLSFSLSLGKSNRFRSVEHTQSVR